MKKFSIFVKNENILSQGKFINKIFNSNLNIESIFNAANNENVVFYVENNKCSTWDKFENARGRIVHFDNVTFSDMYTEETKIVKLPNHTAIVYKDKVTIGCETIYKNKVEEIYKAMNNLNSY